MITTDVGVLDKVMYILSFFEASPSEVFTSKDISALTGLNNSTAYRLMRAMEAHDLLASNEQGYHLGPKVSLIGRGGKESRDNLPAVALPFMTQLNREIDENIHLVTRYHDFRCIIEYVPSSKPIRPIAVIGEPKELHKGATGEVLLAFLYDDPTALDLANQSAKRFDHPPLTDVDREILHQKLHAIREKGFSLTMGGRIADLTSLAAPIFLRNGTVTAALAIVVPNAQISDGDTIQKYLPKLTVYAQQISNALI